MSQTGMGYVDGGGVGGGVTVGRGSLPLASRRYFWSTFGYPELREPVVREAPAFLDGPAEPDSPALYNEAGFLELVFVAGLVVGRALGLGLGVPADLE
jgi:hypothetical protein